jgi:hypothetical protein
MTSFIIKSQANRPVPEFWRRDKECAFCQIIRRAAHAHRVYEDNHVIAFLGKLSQSSYPGDGAMLKPSLTRRYITASPWTHTRRT